MKNKDKVLEKIFEKPTYSFHLRELSREVNLNPNTVSSIVSSLLKEDLIKKEKNKNLLEISFNFNSPSAVWRKKLFNLDMLERSGLIDFLAKNYNPSSIVLIGSYSRGEDNEKSDIDVVVLTNKKEPVDLKKFERLLKREIHLIISREEDLSKEFFGNLINGIVLWGVLNND